MQKKKQSFVELTLLQKYSKIAMQELEFKAKLLRGMTARRFICTARLISSYTIGFDTNPSVTTRCDNRIGSESGR
jgi:hypothetical protein